MDHSLAQPQLEEITSRVIQMALAIQQVPAPTFSEAERSAFVYERFLEEGLGEVSQDSLGNVFARLPGAGEAPPLIITAHLDTVFPLATDLRTRAAEKEIYGPGLGDNALGVAGLFGLAWLIKASLGSRQAPGGSEPAYFPGDCWLVANVGEEGLGNLGGMREVVKRFGDNVLGYIVLEGMALGQVYHRGLGVRRYRVAVRTPGGHSWVDYGKPSAVHELAALITQLARLPLPTQPRTTLNVGVVSGGISINTIAAEATMELDLRSEGKGALAELVARVEAVAASFQRGEISVALEAIGERPAGGIAASHPLVRLARRALISLDIRPNLTVGSTDANIPLSLGIPAVCLGLTTGGGAHTLNEHIDLPPIQLGLQQVFLVVNGAFQADGSI